MNRFIGSAIALAVAGAVFPASAGVTFDNVSIGGSLAQGASFDVDQSEIDFIFPLADVGDNASRSGTIIITYEATGNEGTIFDSMFAGALGEIAGSGQIFFNEVIENLEGGGGILGSYNALLSDEGDLPFGTIIEFNQQSSHIKVKKTFILDGIDTEAFDRAGLDLVAQRLIPSTGAGAVLALAALPLTRRRRA